jgi:tight adherence protein B
MDSDPYDFGNENLINEKTISITDYTKSTSTVFDSFVAFLVGFAAGFLVLFVFYKIVPLSLFAAVVTGVVNIFITSQASIKKRQHKLRSQFFELLEAMAVALRSGNPLLVSLQSAREDLLLIYAEDSDIIIELNIIIARFNNAVPLSDSFSDLAERSGLEDIAGFASIYATIEGKSGRADEIIRETQQIIADKMEIEMEIDTLMTAAKSEVNIMLLMPLVILTIIGYAGAGFMDAIYTTVGGRIVSTLGLIVFIISYFMARKFSNVKL